MDTAFKKDTAGLRDGNSLICIKAILKYRHGSLPQSKLSRELAPASRNYEVPWIYQCGAKPCLSVPKNNLCKSVIICGQKEVRPQMVFSDHRLTQIGTD